MRDQVFISYSHRDQKWLQKLRTHLKPFERVHRIQVWDDTRIETGTKWRDEIEAALKSARVAILLVSPNYLASDFIADQELSPLLAAAEADGLKVIWIAVSASAYLETVISDYQAANDPARPLDSLKPAKLNEELVKICEVIRLAVSAPADCLEPAAASGAPARRPRARAARTGRETTPPRAAPSSQASPTPSPSKIARRPASPTNRLILVLCGLLVALAVGGVFVYSRLKDGAATPPPPEPLLAAEFNDEFVNLDKWTPPPSGWSLNTGEGGQGRLEVAGESEVGFATGVNCGDCEVIFDVKLLNNAGASWALRVKDANNYYLFSLSGPDGPEYPNRFIGYIVRDGKRDLKSQNFVNLRPELLKEGRNYHLEIKVEKNKITHRLEDTDGTGEEIPLGVFVDTSDAYTHGSVGFAALGSQKFSVDDLWVRPLGTQKPQ